MYEKDTIARDSSLKEKTSIILENQMKFSAFSLAGELARYLNISCILTSRILRESVDGIDAILEAVNKYNEILNDVIVPGVFHALYEVKSELHTEDKELVLLKEPKDAGYYEFSAKDELVITNQYKALTQEQIAKSFHADTYCFDSKPEKECFLQYITNKQIKRYTLPECSQQTKEICLFNTMTLNLAVSGITTLTSWPSSKMVPIS